MSILSLEKLNVKHISHANTKEPINKRCYTLTHSDFTGKLFLSIGTKYDKKSISGI